jgi:effector-binding domain-containing protein
MVKTVTLVTPEDDALELKRSREEFIAAIRELPAAKVVAKRATPSEMTQLLEEICDFIERDDDEDEEEDGLGKAHE